MFEKRDPIKVIIFTLITFGIYGLYWYIKTSEALKEQGKDIPHWILLFIPIANLFWVYKFYTAVEEVTNKEFNAILWLAISLLTGIGAYVAIFIIQDKLNKALGGGL